MLEIIIIIGIAVILFLFIRKVPEISERDMIKNLSENKVKFSWVSVRRKIRAFFRNIWDWIRKPRIKRVKKPVKKKTKKIKVNIPKSYNKAQEMFQKGDLFRSEKACLRLITLRPGDEKLYYLLYQIYQKQNNLDEAILALKQAVKIKGDGFWLMELAELYLQKEKYKRAEKTTEEAIVFNNKIAHRFASLAKIKIKLNKNKQAEEAIDRALEMEPNNAGFQEIKNSI